jgi:hypothetical protein
MNMTVIGHVTKPGHKCINPLKYTHAAYIKAGEILQIGDWQLWYDHQMYKVSDMQTMYAFTNFNCAAAKLAELGKGES